MSNPVSGFLNINKPPGSTSHDQVLLARRILGNKKIGHSGTLDKPASGVLVIGAGSATRLLKFITALPKKYTAELVLGKTTTTGDDTGDTLAVTQQLNLGPPSPEEISQAAGSFLGEVEQVPPMYSAKKIQGVRLYKLAAAGEEVERKPQKVNIYNLEITRLEDLVLKIEVECSMGTYIRTLGYDIAQKFGWEGHIRNLCRLSIGSFQIEDAISLSEMDSASLRDALITTAAGMGSYPSCRLSNSSQVTALQNGRDLPLSALLPPVFSPPVHSLHSLDSEMDSELNSELPKVYAALNPEGELVAVCETSQTALQPRVVILQDK